MMFRCPECRTRRRDPALFQQHLRRSGHRLCNCGHVSYGGAAFPHRPGTPLCTHNPLSIMYLAARSGEPEESLIRLARTLSADTPELAARVGEWCENMNLRIAA